LLTNTGRKIHVPKPVCLQMVKIKDWLNYP
jgi:hypothetical protein